MPVSYRRRVYHDRYSLIRAIQADHPDWTEGRVEAYADSLERGRVVRRRRATKVKVKRASVPRRAKRTRKYTRK